MPYFRAFSAFWLRSPYLWIQSLSWWISIVTYFDIQVNPYWNRTLTYHFLNSKGVNHGWTLGGPRYIHLTKGTNAVFSGFSAFWLRSPYLWIQSLSWWISIVTYFDIQVNPYWNRTLTYHFLNSKGVNHGRALGGARYIHLTMRTNYGSLEYTQTAILFYHN